MLRSLIKKLLSFKFLLSFFIIVLFINNGDLQQRIAYLEEKNYSEALASCDQSRLKSLVSGKVVRVIGSASEGTGFPLSKSEIITNYHVIEGEDSPKVVFPDGTIETPIFMKGSKNEDIAVLLLDRELEPLKFANTPRDEFFGQDIFAIGYPLGSGISGDVTIVKGSYSGIRKYKGFEVDMLESSISVERGMSGGPLVNTCGEVLGVTTLGITGTSYFLNINDIRRIKANITHEEIQKINVDTSTPLGIVEAYYYYIRNRDLAKAYALLGVEKQARISLEDYKKGYEETLQVNLISSKEDERDKNKILIKLSSDDWIEGNRIRKYYEGYWLVVDENGLKMGESNIKEITNPDYKWFYD